MKGKGIITILGFICVLALTLSISTTQVAGGEKGGAKRIEGTWVASGNSGVLMITCSATNDASAHSYSCIYTINGSTPNIPAHEDGVFTGPDTFQSTTMLYYRDPLLPYAFILMSKNSGRFRDENTIESRTKGWIYLDANFDGLADEGIPPQEFDEELVTAHRMVPALPSHPFPEYPEP